MYELYWTYLSQYHVWALLYLPKLVSQNYRWQNSIGGCAILKSKKVAERALNAKKNFKAIAALKKKILSAKALQNVKTIAFKALLFCKSFKKI